MNVANVHQRSRTLTFINWLLVNVQLGKYKLLASALIVKLLFSRKLFKTITTTTVQKRTSFLTSKHWLKPFDSWKTFQPRTVSLEIVWTLSLRHIARPLKQPCWFNPDPGNQTPVPLLFVLSKPDQEPTILLTSTSDWIDKNL